MNRIYLVSIVASIALSACSGKSKGGPTTPGGGEGSASTATPDASTPRSPEQVKADLFTAETRAYDAAKPVFENYCAGCHSPDGKMSSAKKLDHLDVSTYPFGGEHKDTITVVLRHALGIDGAKPIMPKDKPGAVKDDELALIAAWADAYDAAENGGAHADKPAYGEPDSGELPDDDD